jgi:cytochrome c
MKFQEFNKVAMVVLGSLTLFFGARVAIDEIFEEHPPETPGFEVAVTDEETEAPTATEEEPGVQLAALLVEASPEAGEGLAKRCIACHSFEKGAAHKIGPNLYGIIGHDIAAHDDYSYSPALQGIDGDWDYERMDAFIAKPQGFAPGTKMAFAGIGNPKQRADLIAYLRSLSDSPPPLPEPAAADVPALAGPVDDPEADTLPAERVQPEAATPPAAQTPASDLEVPADQPVPEATPESPAAAAPAEPEDAALPARLREADIGRGEELAAQTCGPCHTFEADGPVQIGPNLHGVLGRDIAGTEEFAYSQALQEKDGVWDYASLDAFLSDPEGFAPGNNMPIPGIEDGQERADLIAYIRTLSDSPPPLPQD